MGNQMTSKLKRVIVFFSVAIIYLVIESGRVLAERCPDLNMNYSTRTYGGGEFDADHMDYNIKGWIVPVKSGVLINMDKTLSSLMSKGLFKSSPYYSCDYTFYNYATSDNKMICTDTKTGIKYRSFSSKLYNGGRMGGSYDRPETMQMKIVDKSGNLVNIVYSDSLKNTTRGVSCTGNFSYAITAGIPSWGTARDNGQTLPIIIVELYIWRDLVIQSPDQPPSF